MARKRKSKAKWNEEIARNVVQDYANGIATEDIAQIYHVPEETVVYYLESYGLLQGDIGAYHDEEYILQARILQALAEGRNPCTGKPLAEDILSQPVILRALSAGAAALMAKNSASRTGKPWKLSEEERLRDMIADGLSDETIAKKLQRTQRAVVFKMEELAMRDIHGPSEGEKRAAMQSVRLRPVKKEVETVRWTEEEMRKLRDMSQSGMDVLNIATYFGKSVEETEKEMRRLERK